MPPYGLPPIYSTVRLTPSPLENPDGGRPHRRPVAAFSRRGPACPLAYPLKTRCRPVSGRFAQVEPGGKQFAPLYTPKNDTLISLFHITDDEQRKLRTLISRDMAAERHRKRDEARRRAAGAVDRATYEANSASRQKPWESLGMSRASWYRAGKPMPACETGSSPITAAKVERKA